MEEAYQEYLFRQGQRARAAEIKADKEAKPGNVLPEPEVTILSTPSSTSSQLTTIIGLYAN